MIRTDEQQTNEGLLAVWHDVAEGSRRLVTTGTTASTTPSALVEASSTPGATDWRQLRAASS